MIKSRTIFAAASVAITIQLLCGAFLYSGIGRTTAHGHNEDAQPATHECHQDKDCVRIFSTNAPDQESNIKIAYKQKGQIAKGLTENNDFTFFSTVSGRIVRSSWDPPPLQRRNKHKSIVLLL